MSALAMFAIEAAMLIIVLSALGGGALALLERRLKRKRVTTHVDVIVPISGMQISTVIGFALATGVQYHMYVGKTVRSDDSPILKIEPTNRTEITITEVSAVAA